MQLSEDGRLLVEEIARAQRQLKMLLGCLEGSIVEASRRAMRSVATIEERLGNLQKLPKSLGLSPVAGLEETLADLPQLSKLQEEEMAVMSSLAEQLRSVHLLADQNRGSEQQVGHRLRQEAPVFAATPSSTSFDCVVSNRLEMLECRMSGEVAELKASLEALMESELIKCQERQEHTDAIGRLDAWQTTWQTKLSGDLTDCQGRLTILESNLQKLQETNTYRIYGHGTSAPSNLRAVGNISTVADYVEGANEPHDVMNQKARDVVDIDTSHQIKSIGARKLMARQY